MIFSRFIDILLRSIVLNALLCMLVMMWQLAIIGDLLLSTSSLAGVLMNFIVAINVMHWALEIVCCIFKQDPYEDV